MPHPPDVTRCPYCGTDVLATGTLTTNEEGYISCSLACAIALDERRGGWPPLPPPPPNPG